VLQALHSELTKHPKGFRNKPRNRRGQALTTWRAEKLREHEQAPARVLYQRFASAPTGSRTLSQGRISSDAMAENTPARLESADKELLSRIQLRDRGVSAPGGTNKTTSRLGFGYAVVRTYEGAVGHGFVKNQAEGDDLRACGCFLRSARRRAAPVTTQK
jgi:hypothetical protein